MKRSHSKIGKEPLGALEFTASLNGDDARFVLRVLKRFSKTVRRERRQALMDDDDDDKSSQEESESDSEGDEDEGLKIKKVRKQETWMEDNKSYNVPFVGTSVAKGDTGRVIPGEWPTGLLQAYLKASPMAVELTSGDLIPPTGHVHRRLLSSKQGRKTSQTIYQAYLEALAELVTAQVPVATLKRELDIQETETEKDAACLSSTKDSFVLVIMRDRLAGLMALINDETRQGKKEGPLLVHALTILANLAAVSLGVAREVTRALDASLKAGTLKVLLARPRKTEAVQDDEKHAGLKQETRVRVASLRLAAVLVEWQDGAIVSFITTKGSRERKINPGILYVAVRQGLDDSCVENHEEADNDYLATVTRLLRAIGVLLLDAERDSRRSLMSKRDLVDLFAGDALTHISQLAASAPPLRDSQSHEHILIGKDVYSSLTPIRIAGMQSRRILFFLLADSARSPFLSRITGSKMGDKMAINCAQELVRAMMLLLQRSGSLPMQRFLIHCLWATPLLVPHFFRMIIVPDPKQTFAFIARMGFLFQLTREAPPALSLFLESGDQLDANEVDRAVLSIVPANLKKHVLTKAMQSSNALVVSETLKLLCSLTYRFRTLLQDVKQKQEQLSNLLLEAFVRRLPDLQAILSVRSRFDPFASGGNGKATAIVTGHVCKVLDAYAFSLPESLNAVKFDWIKLLPENAVTFCSGTPILQLQLLNTLEKVVALQGEHRNRHRVSSNAIRVVLEIMMTTTRPLVYRKSRSIAVQMIRSPAQNLTDIDMKNCLDYETSLWVDGLTDECVEEFCCLLHSAVNNSLYHGITVAQAWEKASLGVALPAICFSPLITASLSKAATASKRFVLFTCQVVAKCLLFQRHPLPLASLIVHNLADIEWKKLDPDDLIPVDLLKRYSKSLIAFDTKPLNLLFSLMDSLFSRDCLQSLIAKNISGNARLDLSRASLSESDCVVATRQCLHVLALALNSACAKQIMSMLHALIPLVVRHHTADKASSHFDAILGYPLIAYSRFPWSEVTYIDTVALCWSRQGISETPFEVRMMERLDVLSLAFHDNVRAVLPSSIMKEILFFSLLKPRLPSYVVTQMIHMLLCVFCRSFTTLNDYFAPYASLALYWVQELNSPSQDSKESSSIPLDATLNTWKVLVEEYESRDYDGLLTDALEAHLSKAIATWDSKGASLLYSLLLQMSPSETVRLCLLSKRSSSQRKSEIIKSPQDVSLLSSVIAADPIMFGASLLDHLAGPKEDDGSICMLEKGMLDEEIGALSKCKKLLTADCFVKVRDPIVERALTALYSKSEMDNERSHIDDGLVLLLSTPGVLQTIHVESWADRASHLMQSVGGRDSASDTLFRLSYTLLCADTPEVTMHTKTKLGALSSIVLARALDALQLSVKGHFKSRGPSQSRRESGQACLAAFDRMTYMIIKMNDYEGTSITTELPPAMTGAIKACLKYGMAHAADEDCTTSERCLRFIRFLLVEVSQPLSSLQKLKSHCILLSASTIFALVLAHSQFHTTMTGRAAEDDSSTDERAVLELVRILLVCTSLSRDTVVFENEVWATLLSAYNAGMSLVDTTLRRLFHVYADALSARDKDSTLPLMGNLRWKGMPLAHRVPEDGSMESSGWEWLANGLEIARVRATLCQFPVHDRFKPDALRSIEVWLRTADETLNENDTPELSSDTSSDSSSCEGSVDPMEENSESGVENVRNYQHITDIDEWIVSGADIRYSPAFVLPLILGALENSMSRNRSSMKSSGHNEERDGPSLQEFVLLAQRLCDKGALSLALGSLCSDCTSLRKVAVATLRHIKMALDSKDARNLSTWRERPQLAMIVNSVQRGIAVRMAIRLDPNDAASEVLIPKLPALAAIFLARAALIIVKPGDTMFGQMNRYFLRLDNGHGAFQDTNRLPAFISLFCSSSDEPGQARRERIWALQLLKDSFVEEYCYRMVASCHAPELLLTSLGSMVTRQQDDQPDMERILLLDTMTNLLHYGGSRATLHLIDRLGLLSWLRGHIVTGSTVVVLPTLESRNAFLRLTSKAIEKAHLFLANERSDKDCLLTESKALISVVLFIYDDSILRGLASGQEQKLSPTSDLFAALACKTLQALVRVVTELQPNEEIGHIQRQGVSIALASRMLQAIPVGLMKMAVWSLCMAPLCNEAPVLDSACLFSKLVLSFLATGEADVETISAALRRVSLVSSIKKASVDFDDEILDTLLACRSNCLPSCREEWFGCLEALVNGPSTCKSRIIAKAILESNASIARENQPTAGDAQSDSKSG